MQPWTATLTALFLWWFSTGIILLAVRRADRRGGDAHRLTALAGLPLAALGVAGVAQSIGPASVYGVYAGFLGTLSIWGAIELAFLTGVIAGPERRPCPPGLTGWPRFMHAWGTVSHHETLLTLVLLGMVMSAGAAEDKTAVWSYAILYSARITAKLNLFFGVPRINTEFVPERLAHLKSCFRRAPVTPAFPAAITFLSFAAACFAERLVSATTEAQVAGFALLTALSALALIEHWLMVLPLPDAKLWRWMLPPAGPQPKTMPSKDRQ